MQYCFAVQKGAVFDLHSCSEPLHCVTIFFCSPAWLDVQTLLTQKSSLNLEHTWLIESIRRTNINSVGHE